MIIRIVGIQTQLRNLKTIKASKMIKISSAIFKTFFLSLCIVANTHFAFAQTASILPQGYTQYLDSNGKPLSAGKVYNYIPSTTTPKTTWQDAAETIPNANPVILDAAGRAKILGDGSYRQIVKDRNGVTIWDAVTSSTGSGSSAPTATGDGDLVGTIKPWAGMTAPNQYAFTYGQEVSRTTYATLYTAITSSQSVFCNSGSPTLNGLSDTTNFWIGMSVEVSCVAAGFSTIVSKTSSTVTLAANANVTTNTTAVFYPWGRGNGTTTFNVPDLRGFAIAGNNNMGGVASSQLNTTYFGATDPNSVGAAGGNQSVTLVKGNMGSITPSGTISNGAITNGAITFPNVQGAGTAGGLSNNAVVTSAAVGGGVSLTVALGPVQATTTQATSTFTGLPVGGGIATSATVSATGSGYTNGSQTITVSGGTCTTQPQFTITVAGNVFTGTPALLTAGSCTVAPNNPAATTGGGGTGGTLNVTYSAQPISLIQPTKTSNYIIKITPDTNSATASGVTSLGGMTGDIACGAGLLCTGNTISSTSTTVNATSVQYTAPFTGAVQQTQSAYNATRLNITDFGCVADSGVTDNGPCLRAAYDAAAANGASLFIPPSSGYYGVTTCRNNAVFDGSSITVANGNKSVSIYGAGWSEKPFATPSGSFLLPNSAFPSTCSWIRLAGTDKVGGTTFKDFGIGEFGGSLGTPKGLHGIFIDASAQPNAFYLQNLKIDHLYIGNMATGYSIKVTTGTAASSGGMPDSGIYDSKFMNFNADFLGDHVTIAGNTLGQNTTIDSRNVGIEFSNCDGCTSTFIQRNNISNFNGMIVNRGSEKTVIRDNEMELGNVTNSNGAMIDLNGSSATVDGTTITGNHFSQNSTVADYAPIKVATATGTQIYDNRFILTKAVAYDYVTVTGAASGTFVGYNRCMYNAGANVDLNCTISSLGPNGFQYTPYLFKIPGSSSGLVTVTTPAAAGTPTITWPNTSGTVATSASAPIVLNSTTGAISCPTCSVSSFAFPLTVSGTTTSGGIPYFSSATVLSSSAALAANALVIGGGAGVAPSTTTTGTGILTWLGTPSSANLASALTDETGTGVAVFNIAPSITGEAIFTAPSTTSTGAQFNTAVSAGDYVPAARMTYGGNSGFTNLGFWMRSAGDAAFASWAKYDATDDRWEYPVTSTYGSSLQAFNDNLTGSITYYTAPSAAVTANNPITFTQRFQVSGNGDIVVGSAALATNATTGFLFIPTSAGTPTGVPTTYTGRVAIEYDTTNHKICVYDPTTPSWRCSAAM
jgi:hypothetical protein